MRKIVGDSNSFSSRRAERRKSRKEGRSFNFSVSEVSVVNHTDEQRHGRESRRDRNYNIIKTKVRVNEIIVID